jgi:hypothetical protein
MESTVSEMVENKIDCSSIKIKVKKVEKSFLKKIWQ